MRVQKVLKCDCLVNGGGGGFASLYRRELEAVSLISCEYIVLFFNALDIYFDIFFHDMDVIDHTWKVIIMLLLTSIN